MKFSKLFIIAALGMLFLFGCSLDESTSPNNTPSNSDIKLVINEILASNDAANTDENGEYDDWFEIYNTGTEAVNIGGMYVTDDLQDLKKWQIPTDKPEQTTIPAGGFLVIWADGQMDQGVLHVDFKLSSGGEDVAIVESNGLTIIDSYTFGPQQTDISIGRNPDGSDNWVSFSKPTPGASNSGAPTNVAPQIRNVSISPDSLTESTPVTISAEVTDENDNLSTVKLTYGKKDSINTTVDMSLDGSLYKAALGTFSDGTVIYFFIVAIDAEGETAKTDTLSFSVGYIPPTLYINEFLASNDANYADENGEYDDWIEIYNPGPNPIDIGGMYISDDKTDLTTWQIPTTDPGKTTIPAGGFLVLWADKQSEQGILHVEIKLSGSGEDVVLTAPNGTTIIDSYTFGEQSTDVSMGRMPDGSDNWVTFTTPTPGASNH